jgi:hypothetical protein
MDEWSCTVAPVASKFPAVARGMKACLLRRTYFGKDRDNNLTGSDRLIMERWKQFLYENLNIKNDVDKREEAIYQGREEQIEPPTRDEVWEIIRTLKKNLSPGKDNVNAEFNKYGEKKVWEEIHAMIEVMRAS